MNAATYVGIDFGTSYTRIAWFNASTRCPEVLRNAERQMQTPSVIYFGDDRIVVGKLAEEMLLEDPKTHARILTQPKRYLGNELRWTFGQRTVTPVEAVAHILKKLKTDAETHYFLGSITGAVITHPVLFDSVEKRQLRQAAEEAGFQKVELIEEPVAAGLAFLREGLIPGDPKYVLVYDLGGGTFDVALLRRYENSYEVAQEPRGLRTGGEDFDRSIYNYVINEVRQRCGASYSDNHYDLKLLRLLREYKENLSSTEQPPPVMHLVRMVTACAGTTVTVQLGRVRFEQLITRVVEETVEIARKMMAAIGQTDGRDVAVILVGGSSRIPLIQRRLEEVLQVKPIWKEDMCDFAAALGAAYRAYELWGHRPPHTNELRSTPPKQTPWYFDYFQSRREEEKNCGTAKPPETPWYFDYFPREF